MACRSPLRRCVVALVAAVVSFGAVGCGDGDSDSDAEVTGTTTTAATGDTATELTGGEPFGAAFDLSGSAEVPGPGDPDGSGRAEIEIEPGSEELCYSLVVEKVDGVTAAHVHEGEPGMAGPVAVTLGAPTDGSSEGCVATTSSTLDGIREGTRSFYVNIHSADYPDGAVRGQITRA